MKYFTVTLLFVWACSILALAQPKRNSFTHDKHGNPSRYSVTNLNSTINVLLRIDEFTEKLEPFNFVPNQPLTNLVFLEGTKEIELTMQVPRDSIAFYRYSLYENDNRTLTANTTPKQIDFVFPVRSCCPGFAIVSLGKYNIQNKKIKFDIYKTTESHKISTVLFYGKPIQPAKIISTSIFPRFPKRDKNPALTNVQSKGIIKMSDQVGGIFLAIKNNDLNFIYHGFLKHVASGRTIKLSNDWFYDDIKGNPYQLVDAAYFQDKGEYEIAVVPILSAGRRAKPFPQKSTGFRFTVQKETTFTRTEIGLLLGGILLASGMVIAFVRTQGNKKLIAEKQQKELSNLNLNLVRSQLNPHFMFNALASIQNLMNQNDPDNANRYLGKFARLTRHVLKNQELISLAEEINLLEDYLQMEKLRFNFTYTIAVDAALDAANVEIPAMLLQPFVENAVKHGVAGLRHKGDITLAAKKNNNDLQLLITDNGSGFDTNAHYTGLGLSLSRNQIILLNQIYKHTPILLNIQSGPTGTQVQLTFTHWL